MPGDSAGRKTDRQTKIQTDRQTHTHTEVQYCMHIAYEENCGPDGYITQSEKVVTQTPFTLTRSAPIATGIGIENEKIRNPRKVVITGPQQ